MTISSTATRASYTGNAVTTAFSAPFAYLSTGEVKVYLDGVLQSTGYTVSAAPASSGTVTFSSAPGTGVKVVVTRATAKTQNIDYVPNDPFAADVTEGGFDRAMLAVQDVDAKANRALRVADHEATIATLPVAASRAGKALFFDQDGNPAVGEALSVPAATAYMEALRDQAALAEAAAEAWAEEAENTPVVPGQYSALHHARKAQASAGAAASSAAAASAARDTAYVNADVYADTAAGLAGTAEGEQFQVVVGGDVMRYRHDAGPVAVEVARYPTSATVAGKADIIVTRQGNNLYDAASLGNEVGKRLAYPSGTVGSVAGYNVTHHIPVSESTNYYLRGAYSYAWYNSSGTLISASAGTRSITSPAGTATLRVSYAITGTDNTAANFWVIAGTAAEEIEPNGAVVDPDRLSLPAEKLTGRVAPDQTGWQVGKNRFNKATRTAGNLISTAGVQSANASYSVSDFIAVDEGQTYHTSALLRFLTCYDAGKAALPAAGAAFVSGSFTVPAGVTYIRATYSVGTDDALQIERGATGTAYEAFGYDPIGELPTGEKVRWPEAPGLSYLVKSYGGVEPEVESADIQLAVSGPSADASYGATFRGWAERYTPAGISFNAVRIRALGRKADVPEANFWRTIRIVVRAAAVADAHIAASSTVVAVGETIVDPARSTLEDVVVILRDSVTNEVITLDDSDLGAEYLIGTFFVNAEGGAAYGSPHRGTMSNALGSPHSYYTTGSDLLSAYWAPFATNWRLGVDHLLLSDPADTVVYEPADTLLDDLDLGGEAVPNVYNAEALRQYAAKLATGDPICIASIGDSWTNTGYRIHTPLYTRFDAAQGISAPGWVSANTSIAVPAGASRTRSGTWTGRMASTSAVGPDNSDATTTDTAAQLQVNGSGTVAKFFLHYLQQPNGGEFSYSVGGGAATIVDTDGTLSYEVIEINGPGQLTIDIDTAGSAGVTIAGVDVRNETAGEVVLHKLGASGGHASHFAGQPAGTLEAAFTSIAPDVVMICLGTNEHAGSVGQVAYRANIEALMDRIASVAPLADFVLVGPGPNGNTGAYEIDDYIATLHQIAVDRDCAFVSLKASLGTYADANARGLYEDASHPNAAGGQVIGRALWCALFAEG